jgi:hypothetical protein
VHPVPGHQHALTTPGALFPGVALMFIYIFPLQLILGGIALIFFLPHSSELLVRAHPRFLSLSSSSSSFKSELWKRCLRRRLRQPPAYALDLDSRAEPLSAFSVPHFAGIHPSRRSVTLPLFFRRPVLLSRSITIYTPPTSDDAHSSIHRPLSFWPISRTDSPRCSKGCSRCRVGVFFDIS